MPIPFQEKEGTRYDQRVSITVTDRGKITVRMVDRINVDDVLMHLIHRELFRLSNGEDTGVEVGPLFKDFLLKPTFTAGQG